MLFIILILVIGFVAAGEIATYTVYGRFLKDEEIDAYLTKYLPQATLNEYDPDQELFADMPRYLSMHRFTLLSKWHIQDTGVIPRWSKWSDKIDQRRAELIAEDKRSLHNL